MDKAPEVLKETTCSIYLTIKWNGNGSYAWLEKTTSGDYEIVLVRLTTDTDKHIPQFFKNTNITQAWLNEHQDSILAFKWIDLPLK